MTTIFDVPSQIPKTLTYDDIMMNLSSQFMDRLLFLSSILFIYVLLNKFIFNDGARFREDFNKLYGDEYIMAGIPLGAWIFQIMQMLAITSSVMLMTFNILYKIGLKI